VTIDDYFVLQKTALHMVGFDWGKSVDNISWMEIFNIPFSRNQ